jgi:putative transposase
MISPRRSPASAPSAHENGVELRFITPGKPTRNGHIESLNGTLRNECLNENWFTDLADARQEIEAWRKRYNGFRPHSSLGGATPEEKYEELSSQGVQERVIR